MKRALLIIFLPALLAQGYQDYPKWSGYEGVDNAAPPGYSQWMYPGSEDMPEYPDPEPSQASPDAGGWYIPPGALPSGFEVDDPTPTVVDDDTMLVANDDDVYMDSPGMGGWGSGKANLSFRPSIRNIIFTWKVPTFTYRLGLHTEWSFGDARGV